MSVNALLQPFSRFGTPVAIVLLCLTPFATMGQEDSPARQETAGRVHPSVLQKVVAKGEVVDELPDPILYIHQAKNGTFWFGSDGLGVFRYDGKRITKFTTQDGLVSDRIRGIDEDLAGSVFFTTYEGISKFDGRTFKTLKVIAKSPTAKWAKHPNDLWFVGPPSSGSVFRLMGEGLHQLKLPSYEFGDEELERLTESFGPELTFSPYDVYTIATDSRANLWFGTAAAGLCRFDGERFRWMYEQHLTETDAGGSFGIRSILEHSGGEFWICNTRYRFKIVPGEVSEAGTDRVKYQRANGINQLRTPEGKDHVYFMSAIEDKEGVIWMVTYDEGVWRYDGDEVKRFAVKDGDKEIKLFSIVTDSQGHLWLGTHEAGAYRFDGESFKRFRP